ncbi:MAG: type II toxin-antitoxin system HicA family toxin [Methylotenera sp.]
MNKFDKLFRELTDKATSANVKCRDFTKLLGEFGFDIRHGKKGGHKIVTHPHIHHWPGSDYNCGHSKGDDVKPAYIKNILKIVNQFEDELKEILK